ncbi:unnamed protein product [Closterium sp. Naga37s-1]|nr:unnamed protein product [Closterium sp. Naga37s-1]
MAPTVAGANMTPSPVAVRPPVASASLLTPSPKSPVRTTSARATSVNVCAASASAIPKPLERLEVSGSPFERGCAIGARFGDKIRDRVAKAPFLHDDMIPFARTGDGAALLNAFSESNRALYPEYWEELQGMAAGSSVPFHQLLLLNLRKEFGAFLPSLNAPATSAVLPELATLDRATQYGMASDDCTDVLLLTDDVAAVGHNEDADYSIVDNSFFVHMHTDSGVAFTAYTYAGELPTVAFAFNDASMAFTMDAVPPAPSEVLQGGMARNFLARSLMEARCIEDALQRVTGPAVAVGHHYVLMDFACRRIVSVETASNGRHSILELGPSPQLGSQGESGRERAVEEGREEIEGGVSRSDKAAAAAAGGGGGGAAEGTAYLFHANVYTRLRLREKMGPSLHRRQAIARRLGAPTTTQGMLQILSNSDDSDFPIFNAGKVYDAGGEGKVYDAGGEGKVYDAGGEGKVYDAGGVGCTSASLRDAEHHSYLAPPPSPFLPASLLLSPGPVIHTLHGALFNLHARTLTVLGGRPAHGNVLHEFAV